MRTTLDRIRHAILFELVGLIFLIGGGTILTGFDASALGVVGVVASLIATGWNFVFNLSFDRAMLRWRGSIIKTHRIRILHALLFEAGLLVILLPFVAWVLGLTLWQAFLFDLVIAIFYVVYGYAYNWAYDHIFPPPEAQAPADSPASGGRKGDQFPERSSVIQPSGLWIFSTPPLHSAAEAWVSASKNRASNPLWPQGLSVQCICETWICGSVAVLVAVKLLHGPWPVIWPGVSRTCPSRVGTASCPKPTMV